MAVDMYVATVVLTQISEACSLHTLNTKGLELRDSQLLSLVTLLLSSVLNLNGSGMVGALDAALGT
jgi:hypothetical protein